MTARAVQHFPGRATDDRYLVLPHYIRPNRELELQPHRLDMTGGDSGKGDRIDPEMPLTFHRQPYRVRPLIAERGFPLCRVGALVRNAHDCSNPIRGEAAPGENLAGMPRCRHMLGTYRKISFR